MFKYTLGGPFWVVGTLTDAVMSQPEEHFLGEDVPLDIVGRGGTIPGDLGDITKLSDLLQYMQKLTKEFSKKTY